MKKFIKVLALAIACALFMSMAACNSNTTNTTDTADKKSNPELPSKLTAVYGQTLADVGLPAGWAWQDSTKNVGNAGTNKFLADFTETNTYKGVTGAELSVTVSKAAPSYTIPAGLTAVYGQTLANVSLPTGFAWESAASTSVGSVGNNNFDVTFTPADTANYNTATGIQVTIAVSKTAPAYTVPINLTATYGQTLANVSLPTGFAWESAASTSVGNAGNNNFDVTFTPADTTSYNVVTGIQVTIAVSKATPSYTAPTNLAAASSQTLADVSLPTGFAWEDAASTSVGNVGNNNFDVKFTPADTTNYNVVTGIRVTIAVSFSMTGDKFETDFEQLPSYISLTQGANFTASVVNDTSGIGTSFGKALELNLTGAAQNALVTLVGLTYKPGLTYKVSFDYKVITASALNMRIIFREYGGGYRGSGSATDTFHNFPVDSSKMGAAQSFGTIITINAEHDKSLIRLTFINSQTSALTCKVLIDNLAIEVLEDPCEFTKAGDKFETDFETLPYYISLSGMTGAGISVVNDTTGYSSFGKALEINLSSAAQYGRATFGGIAFYSDLTYRVSFDYKVITSSTQNMRVFFRLEGSPYSSQNANTTNLPVGAAQMGTVQKFSDEFTIPSTWDRSITRLQFGNWNSTAMTCVILIDNLVVEAIA